MGVEAIGVIKLEAPHGAPYLPPEDGLMDGNPIQTASESYESKCGRVGGGVWQSEVGKWRVEFPYFEYCEILEGCSVIHGDDGSQMEVRAGDRFVVPAGFVGVWEVVEPCKKVYLTLL